MRVDGGNYGFKLNAIVNNFKEITKVDRANIFVQIDDLMEEVDEADRCTRFHVENR